MTFELVLRATGHIACVLAFGLFIASISVATLSAATQSQQAVCTDRICLETMNRNVSLGTHGSPMHTVVALLEN